MIVTVPVAVGELFDKITILRIRRDRLKDPAKLANVVRELEQLEQAAAAVAPSPALDRLIERLQGLNLGLWDVEDRKRAHEREGRFDAEFVELARRVYKENDLRAAVKRDINALTGSALFEEKSHAGG